MRRLRGVGFAGAEVVIELFGGEIEMRLPKNRRLRGVPLFPQTRALLAEVPVTAYTMAPRDPSALEGGDLQIPVTSYALAADAPATAETRRVPVTAYALTAPAPTLTDLALTVLTDNTLEATGTGDFTISVTQPLAYQGVYTVDASNEGGGANLNFGAIETAPQGLLAPAILRSIDADGSGTSTVGDTFTATPGLWVFDAADAGTVVQSGQWHLDGTPIADATALTRLQTVAGSLTYVGTLTGAGATRTMTSNAIVLPAVEAVLSAPLTTYAHTAPVVQVTYGFWDITAGDASATINGFAAVPTSPAWDITAGDTSATINAFPGQV